MGGTYSTLGRDEKCYKILVGTPEEKKPLRTPRRTWKNNIKWIVKT
jgi:hypothetical protein